jgi:hypothetical protein
VGPLQFTPPRHPLRRDGGRAALLFFMLRGSAPPSHCSAVLLNEPADQLARFGRREVEELVAAVFLRLPDLNRVLVDHL